MDLSLIACDRYLIVFQEGTIARGMKHPNCFIASPLRLKLEDKMVLRASSQSLLFLSFRDSICNATKSLKFAYGNLSFIPSSILNS